MKLNESLSVIFELSSKGKPINAVKKTSLIEVVMTQISTAVLHMHCAFINSQEDGYANG